MGFAELSIADIAAKCNIEERSVFQPSDRFKINYKNEHTCLALQDAKTIIREIMAIQTNFRS